jgi:hypothetical protein
MYQRNSREYQVEISTVDVSEELQRTSGRDINGGCIRGTPENIR